LDDGTEELGDPDLFQEDDRQATVLGQINDGLASSR